MAGRGTDTQRLGVGPRPRQWGALLGLHGDMARTTVLESAMPSMVTAGALAISHNLAPRLAAAMVGYGLLLSLLTLPFWAQIAAG